MAEINDKRMLQDFKGKTFSGFKKSDVLKELLNTLEKGKVEQSCHWVAELVCAGHLLDIWNTIISFYSNQVHLGNPKLIIYLERKLKAFIRIARATHNELELRNDDCVRSIFCEIICILCFSRKKPTIRLINILEEDMNITNITDKFIAPDVSFATSSIHENDPKELFIAINELVYNLEIKNIMNSCYWVEWLIEYESICLKKKQKISCAHRYTNEIELKFQTDVVWLIWELLLQKLQTQPNNLLKEIGNASFQMFALKYSRVIIKKRKCIFYFIIQLLCETFHDLTREILDEYHIETTKEIIKKINTIYVDIKKRECLNVEENEDALTIIPKSINLQKTLDKLNFLKVNDTF